MKILFTFIVSFFTILTVAAQDLLSQQKAELTFQLGLDQINRGQFGPARESFSNLVTLLNSRDLRAIDAEYYLAFCALNLYHEDAEKRFSDFVDSYPNHPKAIVANFELANFFYTEKNYKKSSSYFSKVNFSILSNEQQNRGRFRFGYSLFSQRSLAESLDQFNVIKSQGGQYEPAASYYAGFIEYGQSDFENAYLDLQRAEQNEAYAKIVPHLLASVYYKQKKYDELLTYSSQLRGREGVSNSEEISLLVAEAYFKKGSNKEALAAYATYLTRKEDTADKGILLRAGYAAFILGEDEAALRYLKFSFSDSDSIGYYSAYYLGSL
ncbi:MAG: hypothetical protein ORN54_06720, partial [Cyclobacteriaceae bacterium]|nr:hypothetical protein [Cyclobacteriaceae bacterium]